MHSFFGLSYLFGYVLLIAPPRAIDLTATERAHQGELAKLPLFFVMIIELLIRIALVLLVAVALESLVTKIVYETYMLDTVFGMIVVLGACHSLFYYLLLGYLRDSIGLNIAMRVYRLMRNLCYAAIPGLIVVVPLLIWRWKQDEQPFNDGLIFEVYLFTTLLMLVAGVIEALVMRRKPLGLDENLRGE